VLATEPAAGRPGIRSHEDEDTRMPTYEYACSKCGEHFEVYQTFSDAPLKRHDDCGGQLQKVFAPVGIVLKGSGFYKTDSRSGSKSKSSSESRSESSESKSESKSDSGSSGKTETKSEPKKSDSSSNGSKNGSKNDSKPSGKTTTPA
jgi:putative FmdB family regulatory protein